MRGLGDRLLDQLLLPGECVVWSGKAIAGIQQKISAAGLVAMGLASLGIGAAQIFGLLKDSYQVGNLFPLQFAGMKFIFAVLAFMGLGALLIWGALSKSFLIPAPRYFISQKRVFLAVSDKNTQTLVASYVQPGRPLQVGKDHYGYFAEIPVQHTDNSAVTMLRFEGLLKADFDEAIRALNKIIGASDV